MSVDDHTHTSASVALCSGLLFVALVLLVVARPRLGLDVAVTRWVGARQEPWLVEVMEAVRVLASQLPMVLTPLLALLAWRRRTAGAAALLAGSVAAALVCAVVVKLLVSRPRPDVSLLDVPTGDTDWSFPSASVAVAVVFWGEMLVMAGDSRRWRRTLGATGVVAVAAIGPSRIYVGEHWLTDVLAGYLLGASVLAACVLIRSRSRIREEAS